MEIRRITEHYSVAPQIDPEDMPEIARMGFVAVICNRPDQEVDPGHSSAAMRQAAEAQNLTFHENPVAPGGITEDQVHRQAEALESSTGPVLAYCRSGTRSCFVWAFSAAGSMDTSKIVQLAADAGYDLDGVRRQLDTIAAGKQT